LISRQILTLSTVLDEICHEQGRPSQSRVKEIIKECMGKDISDKCFGLDPTEEEIKLAYRASDVRKGKLKTILGIK
jgi:hypothetical protein